MPNQNPDPTPAIVRLTKRSQFLFVRHGRSERRKAVLIQARRRGESPVIGTGFTATKKIGNAVVRNRAKRRLRAASAALLPRYGEIGVDYVFVARKDTATIDWARLLDDMESALISLANASASGTPAPPLSTETQGPNPP